MKQPSNRVLMWNYTRINNIAFEGRLPRARFSTPDKSKSKIPFRGNKLEYLAWSEYGGEDGTLIVINWNLHSHSFQWLTTLIHEMVHIWFFFERGRVNNKCKSPEFQVKIFEVMQQMKWGLL